MKASKKYCLDCAIKRRPEKPSSDFRGFVDEQQVKFKQYATVLCYGCGVIKVDHNGKRVSGV